MYSFEAFKRDCISRVRLLNRRVRDPQFRWPGVLLLDAPTGLTAEAFELGTEEERDQLARVELPQVIRDSHARRFCWVMPVTRNRDGRRQECLMVILGERGRAEAALAPVVRSPTGPPRLGHFAEGSSAPGTLRVSGRFVEPLLAALERDEYSLTPA